jgi:hypothetical protein
MAASDEQGYEIATTRVGGQPGPGGPERPNRGRFRIALVLLVALAIPAIAFVGPRIVWRPEVDLSFLRPTPAPAPTPDPTPTGVPRATPAPTATPLPPVTVAAGRLPAEPLPIDAAGLRLIDPSTGALGFTSGMTLDNDAVFREIGGEGWLCVCFRHSATESSESLEVSVRHFDRTMKETQLFEIASYQSAAPVGLDYGIRLDLERSPDGRIAYLAIGVRDLDRWTVTIEAIDLERGRLLDDAKLATFRLQTPVAPAPSSGDPSSGDPSAESFLDGPFARLSPDGRELAVVASLLPNTETGQADRRAWFVGVGGDAPHGQIGKVQPVEGDLRDALAPCTVMAWLGPDELLMSCWEGSSAGVIATTARSFDVDGRRTGTMSFQFSEAARLTEPVIDTANRLVYYWEPDAHILHRLDLEHGTQVELVVDVSATELRVSVSPDATSPEQVPVWATATSDFPHYSLPQLVAAPGGTTLYAVGLTVPAAEDYSGEWRLGSDGIWVIDSSSLALVGHWPAAAAYGSIAISPDGEWLTAVGQGGADVAGNPAGWEWSASIHDTADGHLAIQLGSLGEYQVMTLP